MLADLPDSSVGADAAGPRAMPPDLALPRRACARRIARRLARAAGAASRSAWAALIALFLRDWARDGATSGGTSSTYNHILLIPPILAWLVWPRRAEVARLTPRGVVAGAGLRCGGAVRCGCSARVSGVNLARQLGAVVALQAAVLTLLGPRVASALLFPLGLHARSWCRSATSWSRRCS